MKQILTTAFLLTAVAVLISLVYKPLPSFSKPVSSPTTTPIMYIHDKAVRVLVADTPELRERGLSGHPGLAADEGMLFIFEEDSRHTFWMKDMLFSIDIVWVSRSGEIVDVMKEATPESYPAMFLPRAAARYVIELPAGWLDEYKVNVGDRVTL